MHIPELSTRLYSPHLHAGSDAVSVGWIGWKVPLRGETPVQVRELLEHLAVHHLEGRLLGLHDCGPCRLRFWKRSRSDHGLPSAQRNGETWFESGGVRYVMPAMILHYVDAHAYRLPAEAERAALAFWQGEESAACRNGNCGKT